MPDVFHLGLWAAVSSDLARYGETFRLRGEIAPMLRIATESFLFKPGFQAVFLYRLSHAFFRHGWRYMAWMVARWNQFLTAAEIEFNVIAGPGLFIAHPAGIVVGRGTVLGRGVTLFQGVTLGAADWHPRRIGCFPMVGDGVFVFAGAKLVGGIRIGSQVVIGANAVVTTDVPANALVVGNPARIIAEKGGEMIRSWGVEAV